MPLSPKGEFKACLLNSAHLAWQFLETTISAIILYYKHISRIARIKIEQTDNIFTQRSSHLRDGTFFSKYITVNGISSIIYTSILTNEN
jgi:hypothetical protein